MATTHAAARAGDLAVELERCLQSLLDAVTIDRQPYEDDLDEHSGPPSNPANHSGQST
ncbi:hypothetical protein AB0G67_35385 [Streptomyces sp. NPDC021056]|uniref:hypothetical protein n=1 Tax=Streptomyces sp. NPDC021056 TaxID=3155012 RepID=UPI0033EAC26A